MAEKGRAWLFEQAGGVSRAVAELANRTAAFGFWAAPAFNARYQREGR